MSQYEAHQGSRASLIAIEMGEWVFIDDPFWQVHHRGGGGGGKGGASHDSLRESPRLETNSGELERF